MQCVVSRTLGVMSILAACVTAHVPCAADDENLPPKESIVWMTDFTAALHEAEANNKMLMVDCYSDLCRWCKMLDEQTYPDPDVVRASRQFVNVKVNGERSREFVREYRIQAYPIILFLDSKGDEVYRISGYRPPELFAPAMNDVAAGRNPDKVIADMLESTPKDAPSLWRLVHFHLSRRNQLAALPLLESLWRMPSDKVPNREQAASLLGRMYLQASRSTEFDNLLADLDKLPGRKMKETALTLRFLQAFQVERDYPLALDIARELIGVVQDKPAKKELETLIRNLSAKISESESEGTEQAEPPPADTVQPQPGEQ